MKRNLFHAKMNLIAPISAKRLYPQRLPIRPAYDRTILIGAVDFHAAFLQTLDDLGGGMSEVVVPADADDG